MCKICVKFVCKNSRLLVGGTNLQPKVLNFGTVFMSILVIHDIQMFHSVCLDISVSSFAKRPASVTLTLHFPSETFPIPKS